MIVDSCGWLLCYINTVIPAVSNYSVGNQIVLGSTYAGSLLTQSTYFIVASACGCKYWYAGNTNPSLAGTWMYVGSTGFGTSSLSVRIA